MFYPCLESLKKEKFPEYTIQKFDGWLGTRRSNSRGSLNPLQFSLDCEISIEYTLKLFSYCTFSNEIQLFKRKYVLYCPFCGHKVATERENIQSEYQCINCNGHISANIVKNELELIFELTKDPSFIDEDYSSDQCEVSEAPKKAPGLRIGEISNYEDENIRRLSIYSLL